MITTNHGPKRIEKDLMNKEIPSHIIQDEIEEFTKEEEKERIDKIITYRMKMNRTRAGQVLKSKIYNDLVQLGYSFDVIQECLENYQFSNNQ